MDVMNLPENLYFVDATTDDHFRAMSLIHALGGRDPYVGSVPDDYLGTVIGDLNSRRGQIQGQENRSGATQIDALVPLANMFGYATDLRSSTQGRGQYSMEPHSYVEIPKSIAEKIVAQRGRSQD